MTTNEVIALLMMPVSGAVITAVLYWIATRKPHAEKEHSR